MDFKLSDLVEFDWSHGNKEKVMQRMSLEVAESAFMGEPQIYFDEKHSQAEPRWFLMNKVNGRAVALIFTIRQNKIRIISARHMHLKEIKKYGKKIKT